ncbi:glycosyltransferase family 34 protein, partial [Aulographum hederae CBS 113979]
TRIAKASMLFGQTNELYERALASHEKHNEMHGYPSSVLRHSVTTGYWNKISYLMSLIVLELGKPKDERLEWHDASTILLNPFIPLPVFLPPADPQYDAINFIGSRRFGELDSSVFFVRVAPWSVKLLVKAMAIPLIDELAELGPVTSAGRELGTIDGTALAFILNETEFKSGALYEPRHWFNPHSQAKQGDQKPVQAPHFEGSHGSLLAVFPGQLQGSRWKQMADCLSDVADAAWERPYEQTRYPAEIKEFW